MFLMSALDADFWLSLPPESFPKSQLHALNKRLSTSQCGRCCIHKPVAPLESQQDQKTLFFAFCLTMTALINANKSYLNEFCALRCVPPFVVTLIIKVDKLNLYFVTRGYGFYSRTLSVVKSMCCRMIG